MQISVSIKRGQDILLTTFKILNKKDTPGYSSNLVMNTQRNKQVLRENLLIFPCVLFGTYLFVNFHI